MKSIDRFEGKIAMIDDDGSIYGISKELLPEDAKEGDIITLTQNGKYSIEKQATDALRLSLKERLKRLSEKSASRLD